MLKFDATAYRVRQIRSSTRSLTDVADEILTVCPAETTIRPAAYFLPDQLDKIQGFAEMSTPSAQFDRINEGDVTHQATMAYRLGPAALLGGSLFAKGTRHQMVLDRPPSLPRLPRERIENAALVGTPVSDVFFGHYLMDDSATAILAQDFGAVCEPTSRHRAAWTHATDYRRAMDLNVRTLPDALIERAWVFHDVGMNSNRRQRMEQVRQRLQRPAHADRNGHGVFLMRGKAGQMLRHLENEAEVADELARRGFEIVDPMRETADQLIEKIGGASIAVSVEGSALTHAYLTMRADGAMVTIQPPQRFDCVWKDFTDLLGIRYGFVVAEGSKDSFRVDIGQLLKTIDLIAV